MAKTSDMFLRQFFLQLRFNEMCDSYPEKLKTFKKYLENGDYKFRGDMEMWKDRLWDEANKKGKPLPDGENGEWALDDEEWKKLYREFRTAIRQMQINKSTFDNKDDKDNYNEDAVKFLNDYFGEPSNKLFSFAGVSEEAENAIKKLEESLEDEKIQQKLDAAFVNRWGFKDVTSKSLLTDIKAKKHNKDPEFQTKLINIIQSIFYTPQSYDESDQKLSKDLKNLGFDFESLEDIINGFDDEIVDDKQLSEFKNRYKDLLTIVGKNKKIQKQFNAPKITEAIENAKQKVSYDDPNSDNFLEDSKNDKQTLWQEVQQWGKDTYENIFEKYKLLQGDRLYFSPQAKDIVGALNGKTKPTDGLDGILKVADEVKSDLKKKSASAAKYFDWMTKTLADIKKTHPKAFEGALRNGTQLNAIVEDLIRRAVRDSENGDKHAINAARTALEVISVSKYGLTTSKIMDALNTSLKDFTFLSDGKLSWNNNEFTKFVTNAMDKSLAFAMKTVGYGATALVNTINKMGSKFNGDRGGLSELSRKWEEENADKKRDAINNRNTQNLQYQDEIDQQEVIITSTAITDIEQAKSDLSAGKDDERRKKNNLKQAEDILKQAKQELETAVEDSLNEIKNYKQQKANVQQKSDAVNQADTEIGTKQQDKQNLQNIIDGYNNMPAEIAAARKEIDTKRKNLANLNNRLKKIPTPYANAKIEQTARALQEKYNQLKDELRNDIDKWREQNQKYNARNNPGSELQNAINGMPGADTEIQNAITAKTAAEQALIAATNALNAAKAVKDGKVIDAKNAKAAYNRAKKAYETAENDYKTKQTDNINKSERIKQFENAQKRIAELNKMKESRDKEVNEWDDKHKNQYDDLIAYWDFLETGRDGRVGPFYNRFTLSKKKAQADFDTQKEAMFQAYKREHY